MLQCREGRAFCQLKLTHIGLSTKTQESLRPDGNVTVVHGVGFSNGSVDSEGEEYRSQPPFSTPEVTQPYLEKGHVYPRARRFVSSLVD